ncbi:hypothetical protein C7N43_24080 [Sphingobacteriales bacterium UPWRP_1]|nr:hypothetical protein BVG80_12845 [Sphingobacteriales bacterium TSM_CSM]PSJ74433.1 hypothetical protein C7N43_24080 [Sphingobacteriales bacterium UPWRP_1]
MNINVECYCKTAQILTIKQLQNGLPANPNCSLARKLATASYNYIINSNFCENYAKTTYF